MKTTTQNQVKKSVEQQSTNTVICPNCGNKLKKEKITKKFNPDKAWTSLKQALENNTEIDTTEAYTEIDKPIYEIEECSLCQHIKYAENKLTDNGFPSKHIKCRFDNYKIYAKGQEQKIDFFKELVLSWKNQDETINKASIIMLIGNTGTGKGHLTTALAYELIFKYNISIRFIKFDDLLMKIKSTYDSNGEMTERHIIDYYRSPELLIMDEIGIQSSGSEWEMKILYSVLDYRYERGMKTILITNQGRRYISNYLQKSHGRLYSRIFSNDNLMLAFNWQDYRTGGGV